MSEPLERTFVVVQEQLPESEESARALIASLPAAEVIDLARLVRMSQADARAELVGHLRLLIDQARKHPGAHEMTATIRARGDKIRAPVRAMVSIPPKGWPR